MTTVRRTESIQGQIRQPVYVAHIGRFSGPIIFAILKYAKAIYPEVSYAQLPSYDYRITVKFRKGCHRYTLAPLFKCGSSRSKWLLASPTVAECHIWGMTTIRDV